MFYLHDIGAWPTDARTLFYTSSNVRVCRHCDSQKCNIKWWGINDNYPSRALLFGHFWILLGLAWYRIHAHPHWVALVLCILNVCIIVRVHPLHVQTNKLNKHTNIVLRERSDTLSPFDAIHQYCTLYNVHHTWICLHFNYLTRDKQRTIHGFIMDDVYECYGVKFFGRAVHFGLAIRYRGTTMSCTFSVPLIIRVMKSEMSEMHIISMRICIQLIDSIFELIHGNGSCKLQYPLSDCTFATTTIRSISHTFWAICLHVFHFPRKTTPTNPKVHRRTPNWPIEWIWVNSSGHLC